MSDSKKRNQSKVDRSFDILVNTSDNIEHAALEIDAVKRIEKAWLSYRDRQMFRLLKHSVCAAEHSMAHEIIKRISPNESHILKDPCLNVKIKFRFAGAEFPPCIVFKIYSQTQNGHTSKYINGKSVLKSTSPAAQQACSQMGNRQYYNLMIQDSLHNKACGKVTDENEIVSVKDYIQYTSLIDELPAYMGGRSNTWRRLNLNDLPRQTIFYDLLNYSENKKLSKKLAKEIPVLLMNPITQEIQLKQIKILSKLDYPLEYDEDSTTKSSLFSQSAKNTRLSSYGTGKTSRTGKTSSRRSKNALAKVSKMKKIYTGLAHSETLTTSDLDINTPSFDYAKHHNSNSNIHQSHNHHHHHHQHHHNSKLKDSFGMPEGLKDEFEDEVSNLYIWAQNLSVNDEYLNTPRMPIK